MVNCLYCNKRFDFKPRKKFCSYDCCKTYNGLKHVKELFRLSEKDKELVSKMEKEGVRKC